MQTDACTALDWVAGLFFQSGRLLGLIMQAIATVIGADLGGFADEFGACFEESLFCCGRKGICAIPGLNSAK